MALDEYRRKRDARRTPEPVDEPEGRAGGRTFVVQRHSARRLHYDLRLQRGGVLASWAVPKGLPTVPGTRRLAVHTEDHPLAYATFEGTIPQGEYGGGTVDVYDHGRYDLVEERRDGGLTFRLHGHTLRGTWTLIPGRLGGEERNWLLLRRHEDGDPATAIERPRYEPMLATLTEAVPGGSDWSHEIKWDGYRVLARLADGEPTLWSRSGLDLGERFTAVAVDLGRGLRTPNVVVDGEVCALDDAGRPSFSLLQAGAGTVVYYVFDLLELETERLGGRPLGERRELLAALVDETSKTVRLSRSYPDGAALLAAAQERGLEGVVSKHARSTYSSGRRSGEWRKVKLRQRLVLAIVGHVRGEGSRARLGSLVCAARAADGLVYAGHVGTGLTEATIDGLLARLAPLARESSPLARPANDPRLRRGRVTWVEPELACAVEVAEWTADGRIRAPSFKGLVDEPVAAALGEPHEPPPAPERRPARRGLGRVVFPADGLTRAGLLDYYAHVAEAMLPHLRDRPLTICRAPSGIDGRLRVERKAPARLPDWIRRADVGDGDHQDSVVVVDDRAALEWLIADGAVDLLVGPSRGVGCDDAPDSVLLGLDPAPGVPSDVVVQVALAVRDALSGLRLRAYPKTSGLGGLHVVVPITPGPGFAQTRLFARTVARAVAAALPEEATIDPSTGRRVHVDGELNSPGSSFAAPYSVRPRDGAPVSCPLAWDELTDDLDPAAFSVLTVPQRVERLGDLHAGALEGGQDLAALLPPPTDESDGARR